MGWTSYNAKYYKNGKIDKVAEVESNLVWRETETTKHTILKSALVGTTVYSAIENYDKLNNTRKVFATVFLTKTNMNNHYNFSFKDMTENCCPCEYKCPTTILNLLTETDNKYAKEWRQNCRTYHNQKRKSFGALKVGTKIKFISQVNTNVTRKGDVLIAEKCAGAKSSFWLINGYKVSSQLLKSLTNSNYTLM